jgi:hypothetical protein
MAGAMEVADPKIIKVPWDEVRRENEAWIGITQCESYAASYILRHPEILDCIDGGRWVMQGIEVWLARGEGSKADLVFTRQSPDSVDYLIVESEDHLYSRKMAHAKKQDLTHANLLESHLASHRTWFPKFGRIFTAVAAVDHPPLGPRDGQRKGYNCGGVWSQEEWDQFHHKPPVRG